MEPSSPRRTHPPASEEENAAEGGFLQQQRTRWQEQGERLRAQGSRLQEQGQEKMRAQSERLAEQGERLRAQGERLQTRLEPAVKMATALEDKVRILTVLAGVSGVWVWGLIFFPFSPFRPVPAVIALIVLLMPFGILGLFWLGLRAVIRAPERLKQMADEGKGHSGALMASVSRKSEMQKSRRVWRFFRSVFSLRMLILESKELLLQFAVIARLVNPLFLSAVFVAFVISLILLFITAISFFVVMVF